MFQNWNKLKNNMSKVSKGEHRFFPGRPILFGAGIIIILLTILIWWIKPEPTYSMYFSATLAIIPIIGFYLLKKGHIVYLNIYLPSTYWLLIAIFILFQGGLKTSALAAFIPIIIYAGLAMNPKAGYGFTVLSMIFTFTIYFLEYKKILSFSSVTIEDNLIWYQSLYLGTALLVFIAGQNLRSAMQTVSEIENRYHALFDRSNDGVFIMSFDGEILAVNYRGAALLGYTVDELVGLTSETTIPPDEREDADMKVADLVDGQIVPIYERMLLHKSGEKITFEINLTLVSDETGIPLYIQSVTRDVSERKQAEQNQEGLLIQVQDAKEGLQSLSRQLVEVQESERQFLARELHDEIGQTLTGLQFLLETVNKERVDDVSTERLNRAKVLVNELMQRVRQLSLDLRPAMLDDFGLIPALEWLLERYALQTNVEVIFDHANVEKRRFGLEVETAMYRLIQEALNNVAKHADISYVYIYLKEKENLLIATVKDTGKGVDFDELGVMINQTAGITGMRERVSLLDGSVNIHSQKGQGTTVVASIPIRVMEESE